MASLNVVQAIRQYVFKAVKAVAGMKVLILDPETAC